MICTMYVFIGWGWKGSSQKLLIARDADCFPSRSFTFLESRWSEWEEKMWSRRVGKGQKVKDSLDSGKEPGERGGISVLKRAGKSGNFWCMWVVFTNEWNDSQGPRTAGVKFRKQDAFSINWVIVRQHPSCYRGQWDSYWKLL